MIIRDKWGVEIFRSTDYDEIVAFAKKYKATNGLRIVEVITFLGSHHSFI